jgi:hypothetical protein
VVWVVALSLDEGASRVLMTDGIEDLAIIGLAGREVTSRCQKLGSRV